MDTLFTGQVIFKLDQTESTNNFAAELLSNQELFEGTVIISKQQTSGKGQRGRSWHSEPGKNLTLSVLFRPEFLQVSSLFQLSKAMALGISDFLSNWNINEISVKWPNDVYVGDRKIAGILIENQVKNGKIPYSIVGIGLNINQTSFPEEVPNATSLKLETSEGHSLDVCLDMLCKSLEKRYLALRKGQDLDKDYLSRLYRYNKWGLFESGGISFNGKIIGLAKTGKLLIETPEQDIKEFDNNEISFL